MRTDPDSRVTFPCETCGKSISLPVHRCGHVAECPYCYSYVDVPDATESVPIATRTAAEADQPSGLESRPRTDGQLWMEVLAVVCLAFLPFVFIDLFSPSNPGSTAYPFVYTQVFQIIASLQIAAPLLVIMRLGGDPWRLFGIVRPNWIVDALGSCAICAVEFVVNIGARASLPLSTVGRSASSYLAPRPDGIPGYLLLLIGCAAGAFSEELVVRGYLLPRLERLLRSTWIAVLVTTAMFASCHIYQGIQGVLGAAAMGFVYAVSFCLFRRLWPLCVAHAVHNFLVSL